MRRSSVSFLFCTFVPILKTIKTQRTLNNFLPLMEHQGGEIMQHIALIKISQNTAIYYIVTPFSGYILYHQILACYPYAYSVMTRIWVFELCSKVCLMRSKWLWPLTIYSARPRVLLNFWADRQDASGCKKGIIWTKTQEETTEGDIFVMRDKTTSGWAD